MLIRFAKPFDKIAGREEIELAINGAITIKGLLNILRTRFPQLGDYLQQESDEVLSSFILLVKGGEILRMKDVIGPNDIIKIHPPISGG